MPELDEDAARRRPDRSAPAQTPSRSARDAVAAPAPVRIVLDLTTTANNRSLYSGICRVEESLAPALAATPGVEIRYVYWPDRATGFVDVPASVAGRGLVAEFRDCGDATEPVFDADWVGARFVVVGSSWMQNGDYARAAVDFAATKQLELCALMHDLTPHLFPHWFADGYSAVFVDNMTALLRGTDRILVYSDSTRADVEALAAEIGLATPRFSRFRLADDIAALPLRRTDVARRIEERFETERFVVAVGAIHTRKNYELLYDVWSMLHADLGEACPHLLVVGGVSWNGHATARALRLDRNVNTVVHILDEVDDTALDWLYRHCLFTVYPSLYEGWGLPVGESLAYGKVCIASNRSSIPEIAPDLTDLIDPLDRVGWAARIRHYALSPSARKAREDQIAAAHVPTTWADTARGLAAALATPVRPPDHDRYALGDVVRFVRGAEAGPCLVEGWGCREDTGTSARAATASLRFRLASLPEDDLILSMVGDAHLPVGAETRVRVEANGVAVARWTFRNAGVEGAPSEVLSLATIPRSVLGASTDLTLRFVADRIHPDTDGADGADADPRPRGLRVVTMCLQTRSQAPARTDLFHLARLAAAAEAPASLLDAPNRPAFPVDRYIHPWSPDLGAVLAAPKMATTDAFLPVDGSIRFVGGLAGFDFRRPTQRITLLAAAPAAKETPTRLVVFCNGECVGETVAAGTSTEEIAFDVPTAVLARRDPAEIVVMPEIDETSSADEMSALLGLRIGAPEPVPAEVVLEVGRPVPAEDLMRRAALRGAWYQMEPGGVWSIGNFGSLAVAVDLEEGGREALEISLMVLADDADRMSVRIDGRALPAIGLDPGSRLETHERTMVIALGGRLPAGRRTVIVDFLRDRRMVPYVFGCSGDPRDLGVRLARVTLTRPDPGDLRSPPVEATAPLRFAERSDLPADAVAATEPDGAVTTGAT